MAFDAILTGIGSFQYWAGSAEVTKRAEGETAVRPERHTASHAQIRTAASICPWAFPSKERRYRAGPKSWRQAWRGIFHSRPGARANLQNGIKKIKNVGGGKEKKIGNMAVSRVTMRKIRNHFS